MISLYYRLPQSSILVETGRGLVAEGQVKAVVVILVDITPNIDSSIPDALWYPYSRVIANQINFAKAED
jgi:hypothetical protein